MRDLMESRPMTVIPKPSKPQLALLLEVMRWGMIAAPGGRIFGPTGIKAANATITACRRHGWLRSIDDNGRRYWTVTRDGYAAAHSVAPIAVAAAGQRGADRLTIAMTKPGRMDRIHAYALAEQEDGNA